MRNYGALGDYESGNAAKHFGGGNFDLAKESAMKSIACYRQAAAEKDAISVWGDHADDMEAFVKRIDDFTKEDSIK